MSQTGVEVYIQLAKEGLGMLHHNSSNSTLSASPLLPSPLLTMSLDALPPSPHSIVPAAEHWSCLRLLVPAALHKALWTAVSGIQPGLGFNLCFITLIQRIVTREVAVLEEPVLPVAAAAIKCFVLAHSAGIGTSSARGNAVMVHSDVC
jgi:hypothetical protein